ncbi:MAG: PaaI family thioesterase, partial [Crocinitomicaceae bacterium]|nr:PaaI family thioesterase [Crocinitomicaceae bacterium]
PVFEGETLIGTGVIEFTGKSLMVTSGKIIKKDSSDLVAIAQGTFNIYPMEKRDFLNLLSPDE